METANKPNFVKKPRHMRRSFKIRRSHNLTSAANADQEVFLRQRRATMAGYDDPTMPIERKVAIVGIGCRYANGIDCVKKFWEMLAKGLDCTTPPPADRFDSSFFLYPGKKLPGKMYNKCAGYLSQHPEHFDRQFFKISPEEANQLDPQVRLMLEVVWEGLEDAGIPVSTVRGTNTGVYMGVTASEYGVLVAMPNENINQYTNSGTNSCMAANRISYEFDFRGPSFVVDTACSSSLYSVHMACEAIRNGDCDMAVAGGVNISLIPVTSIGFCQAGMLSPDGKSKSFDRSADGYARGEGSGAVILKPLRQAMEDGDRIYAVMRGGALHNDGRTPGIANPSFDAQVSLAELAYKHAMTDAEDVAYVEAHGTGTQIGDRTEANALGEAMSLNRKSEHPPLYIGSVKSNIGHAEGAAGVAGIIKTTLSLYHGQIPKVVHFRQGNENVDFEALNMRVPAELTRWPKGAKKLAGCSSFGFGGANAHLVLEGAPIQALSPKSDRGSTSSTSQQVQPEREAIVPMILFLSAASKDALRQRMRDWVSYLNDVIGNDSRAFSNALCTAAVRATQHQYRIGVIARTAREAAEQIRLKVEHDPRVAYNVIEGKTLDGNNSHRLVFVFGGMGTQWWGVARQLMEEEPQFRSVIKRIDKILIKCGAKWSLLNMLTRETDRDKINQTEFAQPCICGVQIALAELYRMRGVTPDAIIGHSVGEVAAAHAAALISLEDAIKIIYIRARQLRKTSGLGSMVAVLHAVDEVQARLENSEYVSVIDVAAINSPTQIVLSGDNESVSSFVDTLKRDGIRCVVLKVINAFHSYQQEEIKKDFIKKTKFLETSSNRENIGANPVIPLMSTVTNEFLDRNTANTAEYWWKNIRQTVLFRQAVEKILQEGYTSFLEISPHPSMAPAIRDCLSATPTHSQRFVTGSLRRPSDIRDVADDKVNILRSLARLHVEGYPIDLNLLFRDGDFKVMSLPNYPWQRVLCSATTEKSHKIFRFPAKNHPLLGKPQNLSHFSTENAPRVWCAKYSMSTVPWLRDHKLQGNIVIPAAGQTEIMLAAGREMFPDNETITLRDAMFERFIFPSNMKGRLESTVTTRPREAHFSLRSFNQADEKWTLHGKAGIDIPGKSRHSYHQLEDQFHCLKLAIDDIRRRCPYEVDQQEFYARLWKGGFHLGETFRCVNTAYFSPDYSEALLYASIPEALEREFRQYVFHPALLDSMFQGIGICQMFLEQERAKSSHSVFKTWFQVPRSLKKVRVKGSAPSKVAFHVRMTHIEKGETVGDVVAADATNQWVFAQVDRLAFENVHSNEPDEKVQLWRREWAPVHIEFSETTLHQTNLKSPLLRPLSAIGSENPGAIIIIKDKQGVSTELKRRMEVESVVSVLDPRILIDGDERFRRVLRSLGQVTDLIMLSTLDIKQLGTLASINKDSFEEAQTMTATSPISLYRAVVKHDAKTRPRLWMVTRAAHAVHDTDVADPMMASAGAVNLTLMHEDPEFPLITVDLPSLLDPEESAEWLYQYMRSAPMDENFVALRRKMPMQSVDHSKELAFEAHALRIVMQPQSSFSAPTLSSNWQVDIDDTLKQKRLVVKQNQEAPNVSPEDIAVRLSAFSVQQLKDVPSDKVTGLSYLFAGKINNCSEELQVLFRMRNNVLGLRSGGKIKATIWANASELVPIPANLTPVEAINIVRDYLPAFVAFHDTLKLNENGSVIICLSSLRDRVGLATTHLALEQGANVFLHVETDDDNILPVEKLLGILGDSRVIITSGDNFHNLINDGSVDVLLFAGEMTQDNNNLKKLVGKLRPFGTIVQIQGRNGPNESRITIMPPNVYFLSIDMGLGRFDQMKPRLQDSMIRLLQMFSVHNGFQALKSLTVPTAPISKLSRSPHTTIEDITVSIDEDSIPTTLDFDDISFTANGDAAYLVTGGSRGFGLTTVEWLVKSGARHIYIISRSTPEEEAVLKFKSFRDTGARITHLKVDMSADYEVEKALSAIRDNEDLPLEGIFHCAVVYHDCHLRQVTTDTWNKVMNPKAFGALVLHQLTLKMGFSVRYFVMMSSIVEMMGNEGQGAYCAANSFLASLCSMRRKLGLPATVVCPGIINTAGHAAREGFVPHWEKMGMQSLPPSEILKGLGCILATDYPQLGLTGAVDKKEYAKANSPMLSHHFNEPSGTFSVLKSLFPNRESFLATDNDIQMRIRLMPRAEAHELIFKTLSSHLVQRLGLTEDVSQEATLLSIGLDSHMSSELSAVIQESFGVTMTAMELLNDTLTVRSLTQNVYSKVMSSATDEQQEAAADTESTENTPHQLWFKLDKKVQTPSHHLVCFPSVGGGPSMFAAWEQHLALHNVQVISLQIPGWEGRENEKPLNNMTDMVHRLSEVLLPQLLQGRFSFFGHSLGGLTAFELAHSMWKNHNLLPSHLFISAWYAPTQSYPHPEELNISSSAFRKMQRMISARGDPMKVTEPFPVRFSFLDQSTMNNPRLMMRLVASIEAAIMTCKKYRCRHRDRLPCNMTVFGGKNDPFVIPSLLDEWNKQVSSEASFKKIILPGKHMYIQTAGKTILKEIGASLSQTQQQESAVDEEISPLPQITASVEDPFEHGTSAGEAMPTTAPGYHIGKPTPKPRSSFSQ